MHTKNLSLHHKTTLHHSFHTAWLVTTDQHDSNNGLMIGSVCFLHLCKYFLSNSSSNLKPKVISPHTQNQQISKSTIYLCCTIKCNTCSEVSWHIQHSTLPHAVFATWPHPLCCILLYNTCNGILTSICMHVCKYVC